MTPARRSVLVILLLCACQAASQVSVSDTGSQSRTTADPHEIDRSVHDYTTLELGFIELDERHLRRH